MKCFCFILMSLGLFSIFSCSKNHGVVNDSVVTITAHDVEGVWKIIQYGDSGIDRTNDFASINIQFNSGGTMIVSRNDTSFNGNWVIETNIGLDKVNLMVSTTSMPYGILQESWYVQGKSNISLSLFYSAGNSIQLLELERL